MNQEFPPTSWTLLEAACRNNTQSSRAMEELTQRYYGPVYTFFQALLVNSKQDPADHTHSFFLSKILSRHLLQAADRKRGLFRHFLKQALRNYCRDVFRSGKRFDARNVSIEDNEQLVSLLRADPWPDVDAAFHQAWVRSLLQRAMDMVEEQCREAGQSEHLELFRGRYLCSMDTTPSWTELGEKYGLDQKKARSRAETVARQLQGVLRMILIEETGSEQSAVDEGATLLALLEDPA